MAARVCGEWHCQQTMKSSRSKQQLNVFFFFWCTALFLHNCEFTNINYMLRIDMPKLGLGGCQGNREQSCHCQWLQSYHKIFSIPLTNHTMVHWCFPVASICILLIVQGNVLFLVQLGTCPPIFVSVGSPLLTFFPAQPNDDNALIISLEKTRGR